MRRKRAKNVLKIVVAVIFISTRLIYWEDREVSRGATGERILKASACLFWKVYWVCALGPSSTFSLEPLANIPYDKITHISIANNSGKILQMVPISGAPIGKGGFDRLVGFLPVEDTILMGVVERPRPYSGFENLCIFEIHLNEVQIRLNVQYCQIWRLQKKSQSQDALVVKQEGSLDLNFPRAKSIIYPRVSGSVMWSVDGNGLAFRALVSPPEEAGFLPYLILHRTNQDLWLPIPEATKVDGTKLLPVNEIFFYNRAVYFLDFYRNEGIIYICSLSQNSSDFQACETKIVRIANPPNFLGHWHFVLPLPQIGRILRPGVISSVSDTSEVSVWEFILLKENGELDKKSMTLLRETLPTTKYNCYVNAFSPILSAGENSLFFRVVCVSKFFDWWLTLNASSGRYPHFRETSLLKFRLLRIFHVGILFTDVK